MEKQDLSTSLRVLITKLLSQGLTPNYEEVIKFIDKHGTHYEDIAYLFDTLDYIKEDSLLLKLKIQEIKLHRIVKFLEAPQENESLSCPKIKKDLTDDVIYIDATAGKQPFYKITPEIKQKLRVINIDYPEEGTTKPFYEVTSKEKDGVIYEFSRVLEIDHTGKVVKVSQESSKPLTNPNRKKQQPSQTIYHGIVGELFEDLLKKEEQKDLEV